ncbi:PilX N-terminal domain-containing pilus assembly protein [Variovorax sp. YR752]|uniref:PilX N-terminal domain-containing pilus assembly protein n=1 Tax=Variovorax sp. YR752 TaxID=1884383 RepID=UPI003137FA2F
MKTPMPRSQRGAATLAVALMLLAAMLLALVAANRNLLLELRQSANQSESTLAFEAAEAGLEWATALLNDSTARGDDCLLAAGGASFRERHLNTASAALTPRELRPACVFGAEGWACGCPADTAAFPDTTVANGAAFALRLEPGPHPGLLRLSAVGCSRWSGECRPDGSGSDRAVSRHAAVLALQPALASPPAAALTMRPAAVEPASFFAAHFGVSKAAWLRQPAVRTLDCQGECSAALAALASEGVTLVALPGDLLLRGPLTLGTPQRPMLIVASGTVQLQGAVTLHGVLYGNGIAWSAPAATVNGALFSEGAAGGDTSLVLTRDADVLDALRTRQGSFVRLPGSWRDF